MNRFVLTSALALSALVLGQQRASAWCEFKMCGSFNMSWKCGGHHICITCWSDPYCPQPCIQGAAAGSYYEAVLQAPQKPGTPAPRPGIPAPTPVKPAAFENSIATAPVGYYFYPQQAGYGFYQAPSYWYGR